MPTLERQLAQDIVNRILATVPAFGGRVALIADERLIPESWQFPCCGVQIVGGTWRPHKGAWEESYTLRIWVYAEDYSGREAAEARLLDLTSSVWDALLDYAPVAGEFLVTLDEVTFDTPRLVVAESEFAVMRAIELRFTRIAEPT
jgi:hypothetical protein